MWSFVAQSQTPFTLQGEQYGAAVQYALLRSGGISGSKTIFFIHWAKVRKHDSK